MHLSELCTYILQIFDRALDGATANRQIPDRIFGQFFTSLRKDIASPIMHRFGRRFHRMLDGRVYFTTH